MDFVLNRNKIKDISYLINKFYQKEENLSIPKCCLLLGAGTSIKSGIPSGKGIIEICKEISFFENKSTKAKYKVISDFNEYYRLVKDFAKEKKSEFKKYVKDKEKIFYDNIDNNTVEKRIPINLIEYSDIENKIIKNKRNLISEFKEKLFKEFLYGMWFEEYSENPRERQILIEKIIESKKPTADYYLLADLIDKDKLKNVFTSNFDDLLNEALIHYVNIKARVFAHNEIAQYLNIASKRPNIIKLHGDYLFENIKNSNKETFCLDPNMKNKLFEALRYLDLVVAGYGGADYSIMSILHEIKKTSSFRLLWCGSDPSKLHWRTINLINNTSNSFFIKIEDFETLIFKLWNANDDKIFKDIEKEANDRQFEIELLLNKFGIEMKRKKTLSEKEKRDFDLLNKTRPLFKKALAEIDEDKKIALYSEILKIDPKHTGSLNNRALSYLYKDNYNDAMIDLKKAIEIKPNEPLYHRNLAKVYNRQLKVDDALREISEAIKLDDKDSRNYFVRGFIFGKMKKYENAISDFNICLKKEPNYYLCALNLAEILIINNNYIDFKKVLDKLVYKELDDVEKVAYLFLKYLYQIINNKNIKQIDKQFNQIIKKGINHRWNIEDIKEWIDSKKYDKKKKDLLNKLLSKMKII
jgi:tetratricopeptide (TPR) repeat protein/NAD-dependent SIR2 family protein deacetylase